MAAVGPGISNQTTGIWAISILGGAPLKLRDDAGHAAVSPNDAQIAFIAGRSESEIWVMSADGENPRKLLQIPTGDRFLQVQWSPDSRRIAALHLHRQGEKSEESIETAPLTGGNSSTILSTAGLRSFCWSPDGRMIYSKEELPPNDADTNLWELTVAHGGTKSSGSPQRITSWAGLSLSDLSVSVNGIAFVNAGYQTDIYTTALDAKGSLAPPQRFTLAGRTNVPSAWTADGHSLLFYSDRNGKQSIFWQSLGTRSAQDFFWGPGEQIEPRVSPDGTSVLYWELPGKDGAATAPMRLLRVPVSGGAPVQVAEASHGAAVRCVRGRANCILSELDKEKSELVFTALDPQLGMKGEILRLSTDLAASPAWDLSPDGSAIAIVDLDEHKEYIRVVGLNNGASRQIVLDHSERLTGITWSADGAKWFVTSSSVLGAKLFVVSSNGSVSELWTTRSVLRSPVASTDAKNLAFAISTYTSNAWVIQNF